MSCNKTAGPFTCAREIGHEGECETASSLALRTITERDVLEYCAEECIPIPETITAKELYAIDTAILAERERCAKIADAKAACEECADIVAAIRSGK